MRSSGPSTDQATSASARPRQVLIALLATCTLVAALEGAADHDAPAVASVQKNTRNARDTASPTGIHKIRHVVVIMEENRSFDNYFGTFPGADGIPMRHGVPTVCSPSTHGCIRPHRDDADRFDVGGPHGTPSALVDIDGGKMDGFVRAVENTRQGTGWDVMGYRTGRSIPNYWAYARQFVLNDHLFASQLSWSLPEHLYLVSEWSARCPTGRGPAACRSRSPDAPPGFGFSGSVFARCGAAALTDRCRTALRRLHVRRVRLVHRVLAERCGLDGAYRPSSGSYTFRAYDRCRTAIRRAHLPRAAERSLLADAAELLSPPHYAWTDLTYLLHRHHVSWRYYVMNGTEPDCRVDEAVTCRARRQLRRTPTIWNPLPYFDTVRSNDQLGNIRPLAGFYRAARRGTLPAVSWVVPSGEVSDHPPSPVRSGQAFVTGLVNTIMRGPDWRSTAIFLSWDEWGGFYDHVEPPSPGGAHYGLRVPGLVISAYARRGYVDHQLLSHDSYVKFIEDDFLGGARLDPATDGRPDRRREIREEEPGLGDLVHDFDFTRPPRKPVILPGGRIY